VVASLLVSSLLLSDVVFDVMAAVVIGIAVNTSRFVVVVVGEM